MILEEYSGYYRSGSTEVFWIPAREWQGFLYFITLTIAVFLQIWDWQWIFYNFRRVEQPLIPTTPGLAIRFKKEEIRKKFWSKSSWYRVYRIIVDHASI